MSNENDERFLHELNSTLALTHTYNHFEGRPNTSLFIVGAPRSGTTLLSQLIATHLEVGFVNRLIAAFWRAPLFGIRLSKHLGLQPERTRYESCFGRTRDISEPHEFGRFWMEQLGHEGLAERQPHEPAIDWEVVTARLRAIAHEFGLPTVHKPLLLDWHIPAISEAMPESCFLWIRRDPVATALSLLRFREATTGSVENWVSLRPLSLLQTQGLSPPEQVARQVHSIEKTIAASMANLGDRGRCITYQSVCEDPRSSLAAASALFNHSGSVVRKTGRPPPPRLLSTDATRFAHSLHDEVASAVNSVYESDPIK